MKKKLILSLPILLINLITIIAVIKFSIPASSTAINLLFPISPEGQMSPNLFLPPIFSLLDPALQNPSRLSQITNLIAVGDIMLGRYCNVQMLESKDWHYPFIKTADLTSSADITFGNLEAPFVENCPTSQTGMVFCARPEAIEGLKFAGFDVISLANNHILNYSQKGLEHTRNLLKSSNILFSPLSSSNVPNSETIVTVKQLNNISFGFLAYDLVTYPQTSLPLEALAKWGPTVDVLIVSLHWGNEYQKNPTQQQKELARQIIDAGAKIIIGHHPHVTQPVEEYHGGLIFYSLGNFVFDQSWSEETKKGQVAKIVFEGKEIKSFEPIPVYTQDYCQPILER